MRPWRVVVTGVLVAVAAGACGTPAGPVPGQAGTARGPSAAATTAVSPSESAKMVCAAEGQKDISEATGMTPERVDPPTWIDQAYSCRYVYPDGSFSLSVKELSGRAETDAYFAALGNQLGNTGFLDGIGEGAFTTSNGSVVVRKDWKVLFVDDAALPAQFGNPPTSPASTALLVAKTVLGCWTGA